MTEVLKNEVLLWPPPLSEEEGEAPEEADNQQETVDLFTLIHSPGKEGENSKCLPGGPHQLEILLNKVVFDSQTLYPDCTRDVQKRIVGDLQRCYARTGGGRELSVKEWADGNQNRGILRLRLRCKKAKCKLQFQVNWDTVHKHWFITRQCENLVHTCPVPKPKSTTTRRQPKHNNHVASTPTKTSINGGVKNDIVSEKVVSDEKIPAFVNAPADPPPPPVVEVVSSMPPPVQNPTPSQQTPFAAPVVVLSSPQPPPPMPSAPAPMVITEADRAEAELLATDLRGWVPPPDPNNPSQPPQQPPAPPAIPPPHLAMYDEAALMQSGHAPPPPVETLSIPQTKTTQPLPLPQPPQFPAPLQQPPQLPSPTNIHSSSSKSSSSNNNNTLPTPTIQIPTPSQLPNPPSPLSPARCMSGDAAMALNSMSIGANSIAMSVDGDTKEVDVPVLDGTTNDGMSVLSEYDDIMLTLGSISSKQWMNGLSHAAPRHSSDHYSSIGSLYNTNNRPPSQQGLVVTTSTSTQLSASATSTNNMMINDQTMNSLTDSVRNMLSIVGGTNGIVMPPVGEISSSQGSASFLLGSQRSSAAESSNPQPPQGILDNDFFRPPPNLSKDVTPPPAPS